MKSKEIIQRLQDARDSLELNLIGCRLRRLPEEVFRLEHIKYLWLNNNLLFELPLAIANLKNLEQIGLMQNRFTEFPEMLCGLPSLEVIGLGENDLRSISVKLEKLRQLKELYLNKNRLTELPDNITSLDKLEIFDIRDNRLPVPGHIANQVEKPTKIIDYYLSHRHYSSFPQTTLPSKISSAKRLLYNGYFKLGVNIWNKWRQDNANINLEFSDFKINNENYRSINLSHMILRNADFRNGKLTEANFANADLSGADFRGALLMDSNFENANLTDVKFDEAYLYRANFRKSYLRQTTFYKVDASGADFRGSTLYNTDFSHANLSEVIPAEKRIIYQDKFGFASVNYPDFSRENLSRAGIIDPNQLCPNLILEHLEGEEIRQAIEQRGFFQGILREAAVSQKLPPGLIHLIGANFSDTDLTQAIIKGTRLRGAIFRNAVMHDLNLSNIDLSEANLSGADMRGCYLFGSNLSRAIIWGTDLSNARLNALDAEGVHISGADLSGANIRDANFSDTDFSAVVTPAVREIPGANLKATYVVNCDFSRALLNGAELNNAMIYNSRFDDATMGGYRLGGALTDLAVTRLLNVTSHGNLGLERIKHRGASLINQETLNKSPNLPIEFLRGCQVSEEIIADYRSLKENEKYHSCFISYSRKNSYFAQKLFSALESKGIQCFLDMEDMRGGDWIHDRLISEIKSRNSFIIILSKESIKSRKKFIEMEVEAALIQEKLVADFKFIPICIDKHYQVSRKKWVSNIRKYRNILDFFGIDPMSVDFKSRVETLLLALQK